MFLMFRKTFCCVGNLCSNLKVCIFHDNLHFGFPHETDRSSHQRCSIKIGVLKNFAKFTK